MEELFCVTRNSKQTTTIVLIHSALSDYQEWDAVSSHLPEYHLLIPDLPSHSRSKHITPFSLPLAADKIASLIKNHAHTSKAHLAGTSIGGFVALEVLRRHPSLVLSAFVSGTAPLRGLLRAQMHAPAPSYYAHVGLTGVPYNLFMRFGRWASGMQVSDASLDALRANCTWETFEALMRGMREWREDAVRETGRGDVRVLAACGGRPDDPEAIRDMVRGLRSEGKGRGRESVAIRVKDGVYAWHLQSPLLFAGGLKAWVEGQPLPPELELLQVDDGEELDKKQPGSLSQLPPV